MADMKKRTAIMTVAGIVVAVLVGFAVAETGTQENQTGGCRHGIKGRILNALMQLNVTDEQKKDIALVLKSHRDDIRGSIDSLIEARKAVNEQIAAESVDENAIRAAYKKVAAIEEDMAVKHAVIRSEVWKILTPEQCTSLDTMRSGISEGIMSRIDTARGILNKWIDKNSEPLVVR